MKKYTVLFVMEDSIDKLQETINTITQTTEFAELTTSISMCQGKAGGWHYLAALTYCLPEKRTKQ